jgi:hypothetical protein
MYDGGNVEGPPVAGSDYLEGWLRRKKEVWIVPPVFSAAIGLERLSSVLIGHLVRRSRWAMLDSAGSLDGQSRMGGQFPAGLLDDLCGPLALKRLPTI